MKNAFKKLKTPTNTPCMKSIVLAISMITLVGCGDGDDTQDTNTTNKTPNSSTNSSNTNSNSTASSNTSTNGTTDATSKFTKKAKWEAIMPAGQPSENCYDFDASQIVDCQSSDQWDVKLKNSGRNISLWTNGGVSGQGKGAALVSDWSSLKTWQNATTEPKSKADMATHYRSDTTSSVFSENKWYAYNLQGQHKLAPNFRTYLITTDNSNVETTSTTEKPVFALQVINYYDATGKSGNVTIRWIDTTTPDDIKTKTIDATSRSDWQYVNLSSSGSLTNETSDWHIAIKRNNIKLNGGDSKPANGSGKVAGFLANTPDGFYDAKGEAIKAKFATDNTDSTKINLSNVAGYAKPSKTSEWILDTKSSSLNQKAKKAGNDYDYGWYTYSMTTHTLSANPESTAKAALIRSNTGDGFARMRLSDIKYANDKSSTWTFDFDVQPK